MAPAAEKLQEALNNTTIVTPRIPVISNVDAQPHSDPAMIKAILAKQVRLPGDRGGGGREDRSLESGFASFSKAGFWLVVTLGIYHLQAADLSPTSK
jgi:hypothetical protein